MSSALPPDSAIPSRDGGALCVSGFRHRIYRNRSARTHRQQSGAFPAQAQPPVYAGLRACTRKLGVKMPSSPASTSASAAPLRNRAASDVPAGAIRSRSSTPVTPAVRARPAGMRASDDNDFSPLKGHVPGRCRMTVFRLLVDCFDDLKAGALHGLDVLARGQQLGCCIVSFDACPSSQSSVPGKVVDGCCRTSALNHQFLPLDRVRRADILMQSV